MSGRAWSKPSAVAAASSGLVLMPNCKPVALATAWSFNWPSSTTASTCLEIPSAAWKASSSAVLRSATRALRSRLPTVSEAARLTAISAKFRSGSSLTRVITKLASASSSKSLMLLTMSLTKPLPRLSTVKVISGAEPPSKSRIGGSSVRASLRLFCGLPAMVGSARPKVGVVTTWPSVSMLSNSCCKVTRLLPSGA